MPFAALLLSAALCLAGGILPKSSALRPVFFHYTPFFAFLQLILRQNAHF